MQRQGILDTSLGEERSPGQLEQLTSYLRYTGDPVGQTPPVPPQRQYS